MMHAVIGVWDMGAGQEQAQQEGLDRIVEGVSRLPGFHQGYWCAGPDARSHTFIVFTTREAAESFADEVRGNAENQARAGIANLSLDVVEVTASR